MSATIRLPSSLHARLAAIRRRARFLRAVRGLGWLVLLLALSGAAVLLVDYWLDLPAIARQILFSAWVGEGIALLLGGVLAPLGRRLDAAALAAVIEEKYPDLRERLTSSVELAKAPTEGHGSPLLIALLMDETERRSAPLDFRPAMPARRAGVVVGLAALVVLLVAAPAFVWPGPYGDLARRFFRPWDVPPVVAAYTIEVVPGDVIAARGRDVTLSAHLCPREEGVELPATGTLVVAGTEGEETRQAMKRTGAGDFTLALNVSGEVSYRVEAGEVVSEVYRITAVTPVELAAESPAITITPPAYARKVLDEETFHGLVDLSALQHSAVRFDFRFSRPAVAAHLEWIAVSGGRQPPDSANHPGADTPRSPEVVAHPLTLSEDRRAAFFTMPAIKEGKYRVILEAEHGIRTVLQGGTIQVRPDRPPSVVKFAGKEDLRAVLSYERVPLRIETADDVAVAGVELEYRVNDGEIVRQSMTLEGGDTPSAVAGDALELAGKVKENDRVHYRFRVRDNLPKEFKGPNVIVYPADRWLTLQVMRRGDPLQQKEILAQREEIKRRLEAIRESLLQERRGVYKVQQETRNQASLSAEQAERVKNLQHENRTSQKALRDVARIAEATTALHPVAELARDVAEREMQQSQQALEQAPSQPSPPLRTRQFEKADQQLDSALKRFEELKKLIDRLAQERLDRARLEALADREKGLAEQAAELAAKHPVLDPSAKSQAEKVRREQAEVAAELERMAQQSEPLKQAREQARGEEALRRAERARELARAQRELARAEAEAERQRNRDRLAELARKQQELAAEETKLASRTRQPAEIARTSPLQTEEARRAAEALKRGEAQEAVKHQDQAAHDLERLARELERAVKLSADPKESARQLAQAEKALRQRVREEAARKDDKTPLAERLQPLEVEQNAIEQAAERLSVPPNRPDANKAKQQTIERAAEAAESIHKQDGPQAQAKMEETQKSLNRLADLLPTLEQRRQQARQEAERLRQRQEEIARQIAQIKKDDPNAARRLAEAARHQAEVAEALSKIDAPNQEQRRGRTTEAAKRALADLRDARREDVPASQQEAKRQIERLEQALRGEKPADERARELAHKQQRLAEQAARTAADPKTTPQQKQELQRKQEQIAEQTRNLSVPEAPQRQREAAEATRQAAIAPSAKRMEAATRKLDELARQMNGEEAAGREPESTPRGLPSKEQSEAALQLARRQRELRDAVQQALQTARGERSQPPAGDAPRQARQQDLQQQASDLARELGRMARQAGSSGPTQSVLQRATGATQLAEQAMRQAREQARQGQSAPERQSQERAAQALDQAARDASQAAEMSKQASAKVGTTNSDSESRAKTGEALAQAQQKMSQAGSNLSQGQTGQAQSAMRQAASSLAQAARQMTADARPSEKPGPSTSTAGLGRLSGGLPDLSAYGLDKTTNAKSWGELPGELRTKIVQDMKARYGEDYARAIKYYFEQIADTKNINPR